MINYFCDACGKSCDNKYISIKITPDLKHDSRTDTIYASLNTEEKTATRLLCPDCLESINDFIKERAVYNAQKKLYG